MSVEEPGELCLEDQSSPAVDTTTDVAAGTYVFRRTGESFQNDFFAILSAPNLSVLPRRLVKPRLYTQARS